MRFFFALLFYISAVVDVVVWGLCFSRGGSWGNAAEPCWEDYSANVIYILFANKLPS